MTIHKRENEKIPHANFNGECCMPILPWWIPLYRHHIQISQFLSSIVVSCALRDPWYISSISLWIVTHIFLSLRLINPSRPSVSVCGLRTRESVYEMQIILIERTKAERKRWREEWQMIRIHIFVFDEKWDHKTRQEGTRNVSRMKNRGRSWKY